MPASEPLFVHREAQPKDGLNHLRQQQDKRSRLLASNPTFISSLSMVLSAVIQSFCAEHHDQVLHYCCPLWSCQ